MNTPAKNSRWTRLMVGGALLAAMTIGVSAPAFAAPGPSVTSTTATAPLPPLDPAAIRTVLDQRPGAAITGAFVRVGGSAGSFVGASGTGNQETGAGVDPHGRFRIGSISKAFTTTVALQLVGEHRLSLDDTVQQYLPEVLPEGYPPVTVRQLLNHTSGLSTGSDEMWGDGTTAWFAAHRLDAWTPEQVVATLRKAPRNFDPGTAQQYNGMNTFLAGMIVEKVTGHSFAHEVKYRITGPLGLRQTSVPDADDPALPHPTAHGYLTVPDQGGNTGVDVTEQSPWPWVEGGMISSAADLDRFITALYRGRLLPASVQENLFTVPDVPNFHNNDCGKGPSSRACLSTGLQRIEQDGVVAWGKTGSRPGYTSGVFATRDLSRTLVYSVNPTGVVGAETPYVSRLLVTAFGFVS
ncbi:serine hydrolase domain-containing protein [Kitasatospora sp. NPDC017646]|uniref:serine hydrolase domain-containing protein n=1 Tax=Kitasatospora sp. NPDC017646 TaxID=3364024 RepID=UPI00379C33D0